MGFVETRTKISALIPLDAGLEAKERVRSREREKQLGKKESIPYFNIIVNVLLH